MNIGIKKSIVTGGKEISIETGKLAKQADGSVVLQMGNTVLLATVVAAPEAKDGVDFLPLTVDYREKYAAAGRFPGGFFRREARPSETEILVMRLVDRALRPLFPDDYHAEVQLMIQLLSYDGVNNPDALCGLAASAAIAVSDIPFNGPMSEVRVGRINGEWIVNPSMEEMKSADIDMMVAGTMKDVNMIEGEFQEISELEMVEAIKIAHAAIKEQCQFQLDLAALIPTANPKRVYSHETHDENVKAKVYELAMDKCKEVARQGLANKAKRTELFDAIKTEVKAAFSEEELATVSGFISTYFSEVKKKAVRWVMLNEQKRLDGRKFDEIRPIWAEVDYLPMVHGSAVFTRGETQSLTTLTLGGKMDEQLIDGVTFHGTEKFLLHYNFPPFSTGEAKPLRGTSRREIGHGNLALRALKPVLPADNAYTIRLVSDILESNGSSSMATVCAGTLALMDGGVQIKAPVSGIAMGLVADEGKFAVLSDILGDEDHLGDMDFKVTGTSKGITACQMDIKVDGLPYEVLIQALDQARAGRIHILNKIIETIAVPNPDFKPQTPRIEAFNVPNDMIGAIIGPGGKIIQGIQKDTKTTITIEELETGEGRVQIMSNNAEDMDAANSRIRMIAFPPVVDEGAEYEGKVKAIKDFGVFVEILPGTDGLIHISEFSWEKVAKMEDVVKEGDVLKFKVVGKDPKTKKWKLSRRVLLPRPEKAAEATTEAPKAE
ncbi:polyribonucleotide nucleotidyltransferase [Fluviicola taffensis]|uniref:Polyribonucleotide nucleotidyltransferase n=1 Tax=Fluviicola taffensis (strain DSM 16823 / NCIMB 13979 / RW262) TaxID=755732 RepID=F2ICB5_FLUTR|nr:polyribonucleotide nucleotidyltransferase [Fluviicola taffensis]AEA44361.1 Polyribonucleotide nucleotidyltransferase [Fluviicola taffensis DSM 16823]